MKRLFLSLFLLLNIVFVNNLSAQLKDNYIKGAVVLKAGQKLNGFIKHADLEKIKSGIFFKASVEENQNTAYAVNQVRQVLLETGQVYESLSCLVPKTTDTVSFLASLILKGKASLYETNYKGKHIYILQNNDNTYWLQDDEIEDGALVRYYFKNMLFLALNDKNITEQEVTHTGFDDKSLIALVSRYNQSSGSVNEVVDVKKKATSFIIAGLGGMYKKDTHNEFYVQAVYRAYFPSVSQNTSLNMGLSYFRNIYEDDIFGNRIKEVLIRNLYSVPFYMQQNLLNKGIRPYLFGGLNVSYIREEIKDKKISVVPEGLQQNYGLGFLLGGGIEADVLKRILLKAEYRYENFPHLIMVGVAYKFQL